MEWIKCAILTLHIELDLKHLVFCLVFSCWSYFAAAVKLTTNQPKVCLFIQCFFEVICQSSVLMCGKYEILNWNVFISEVVHTEIHIPGCIRFPSEIPECNQGAQVKSKTTCTLSAVVEWLSQVSLCFYLLASDVASVLCLTMWKWPKICAQTKLFEAFATLYQLPLDFNIGLQAQQRALALWTAITTASMETLYTVV